jgi:large subunit ribosomal protein L30
VAMLKITQVKSTIGRPPKQRGTLRALGLKRINHSVIKEDRPEILGMATAVRHLVKVEVIEEPGKKGTRKAKAESSVKEIEGEA